MDNQHCTCSPPAVTAAADLGVTHSAAAISIVSRCLVHREDPRLLLVHKFPTVLGYSRGRFRLLDNRHQLRQDEEALKYFKLLLLPDDDLRDLKNQLPNPSEIRRALGRCEEINKRDNMVRQYVTDLLKRATQFPGSMWNTPGALRSSVVTYPSIYNTEVVNSFREIVQGCSRGAVTITTEHEAALCAVIAHEFSNVSTAKLRGLSVMVADIGGVTVDVALHQFPDAHGAADLQPPTPVSMPTGVILLDAEFERLFALKMVASHGLDQTIEAMPLALATWNKSIKPRFKVPPASKIFPVACVYPACEVELTEEELDPLFEKYVEKAVATIYRQWTACRYRPNAPKALFVTGGIVQNPHVQHLIRTSVARNVAPPETLACVFTNATVQGASLTWHAVVVGAALSQCPETLRFAEPTTN